jgi:hypothetical protein
MSSELKHIEVFEGALSTRSDIFVVIFALPSSTCSSRSPGCG